MSHDPHTTYGPWASFAMPRDYQDLNGITSEWLAPTLTAKQLRVGLEAEHPDLRHACLCHPNAPQDSVRRLVDAGSTADLKGLSGWANPISASDWKNLKAGGPWARLLAVLHPSWAGEAAWDEIDTVVKKLLALQLKTPERYLKLLLCDEEKKVRYLASRHPRLSALTRQYQRAGTDLNLRINNQPQQGVEVAFLLELAQGNRWQRQLAARHFQTPAHLIDKLSKDASHMVRRAVSANPVTSAAVLDKLAKDSWEPVRVAIARNAKSYADTLEALSRDPDGAVRLAVAHNRFTPEAALANFLTSRELDLQRAAAANPRTPRELRLNLSQDPTIHPLVREAARQSLSLPESLAPLNNRPLKAVLVTPAPEEDAITNDAPAPDPEATLRSLAKLTDVLRGTRLNPVALGALKTKEVTQSNVREHIDQIAVAAVLELESHLGHRPTEMPHHNVGFDVLSKRSEEPLYLEVKGKGPDTTVLQVSRSQINFAHQHEDSFLLAVIVTDTTQALAVHYVAKPFRHLKLPLPASVLSVSFNLEPVIALGTQIWTKSS